MIYKLTSLLLVLASGCATAPPPEIIIKYTFDNQSGHTVAVAYTTRYSPEYNPNPGIDSLVLDSGKQFTWVGSRASLESELEPQASGNIYYDGRYKIAAKKLRPMRRLDESTAYRKEPVPANSKGTFDDNYIYTFTEEDYDYAVENGTDLLADRAASAVKAELHALTPQSYTGVFQ